jgi:hypothetical protein
MARSLGVERKLAEIWVGAWLPKGRSTPRLRGFPHNKGGHLVNDLRATLTSPWGVVVELLPRGAGGRTQAVKITDDEAKPPALSTLRGRNSQSAWKLTVQDLGARCQLRRRVASIT